MTLSIWREVLWRYYDRGNPSEKRMALILMDLSMIDDPRIEQVFDRHGSNILEATP